MTCLVSIVVPVYNIEEYIGNCLKSLVAQTYQNIEIVCVDDGSKDNGRQVIESYALNDNRIKYVYQDNKGLAGARNTGIRNSSGSYITFVDGDDYLHKEAVEILLKKCTEGNYDFVTSLLQPVDSLTEESNDISDCTVETVDTKQYISKCNDWSIQSSCGKLYKKEMFEKICFDENIKVSEDMNLIFSILLGNYKMGFVNQYLYFYYNRHNSLSRRNFSPDYFDITEVLKKYTDKAYSEKNTVLFDYLTGLLMSYGCLNRMKAYKTEYYKKACADCRDIRRKWTVKALTSKTISRKIKLKWIMLYSRLAYDFVRYIIDPTMKDFYKQRKMKGNAE